MQVRRMAGDRPLHTNATDDGDAATVVSADEVSLDSSPPPKKAAPAAQNKWAASAQDYSGGDWGQDGQDEWGYH